MNQYTVSFSSPSTDIQNIFANKISILDKYVLFQTGENEYSGLIYDIATKKTTKVVFRRGSFSGDRYWTVDQSEVNSFDYNISNQYYCFSNVGYGKALSLPVYDSMVAISCTAICTFCCLLTVFWTVFRRIFK